MGKNIKIVLIVTGIVIIASLVVLIKTNLIPSANLTNQDWLEGKNKNLPKKDEIITTLPSNASTVRLNLPTNISNLMISSKTGLGGLGVETDDPKVYDFVWMDIKQGSEINSLTSGTVTKIDRKSLSEYEITINSSYGLWIKYRAIKDPKVKESDIVREGQAIGLGLNGSQENSNLLAFSVADENLTEGEKSDFSNGIIVKPLDYLKPDVKAVILQKYK